MRQRKAVKEHKLGGIVFAEIRETSPKIRIFVEFFGEFNSTWHCNVQRNIVQCTVKYYAVIRFYLNRLDWFSFKLRQ